MSTIREARGHFDLQLNLKSCRDSGSIKYRIHTLEFYLSGDYGCLQSATRNLLGVLYFYLGQYHQAYVLFDRVLQDDPNNLNALDNLRFVCHRLMNLKDAEKYKQMWETLDNNADTMTRARFKAEHAYAHAFEVYGATDELLRYCESNGIYDECLRSTDELAKTDDLAGQNIKLERAQWLMCKIWNFKKLFNRNFKKDDSKSKNEEMYPLILSSLFDIQDLVPEDSFLNSLVWGYLGYFFWKKPISPGHGRQPVPIPKVVEDRGIGHLFNDPEHCFLKALEICEVIEVLLLYTGWLFEEKKLELGIKNSTRCIDINQSKGNYGSYLKRGELLLATCKAGGNNSSELESDIQQAISDFEFAATANPSSFVFGYLGDCYCITSNGGKNEMHKSKCLAAFQRGLDCLDGQRDPRLHLKHAKCLKTFGEHDSAIGAMQRSVENQYPNTTFVGDVEILLKWYIEKFCAEDTTLADAKNPGAQDSLIPEAGFWFYTAFSRYKRHRFTEMMKTLLNGSTEKINFFTKLFGFLWNKNYPEMNTFLLHLSLNYKNTPGNISMLELQDVLSASLRDEKKTIIKRSKDLRPRNRQGYDFDFFVIYSHHDQNWVLYSLLAHLEQNYDFKGYIDDRDFSPGKYILQNIEDAIKKCFKFIIVITPAFLESSWCEHETQSTLTDTLNKQKTGAIIPIVMDGAKPPDFLNSIIHLNMAIEHRDFERLVNALDK